MVAGDSRKWAWAGAAAISLLALLAYLPVLGSGYIWDDDDYLLNNPHLDDADGLARLWVPGHTKQYYPLVFTTFWIEKHLWGLQPGGYHAVNLALHVLNALLAWRVFALLRVPGAWMIGAAFALHPVHVESVAWITERKNVLSGLFYLCAAWCYLRFDPPTPVLSASGKNENRWRWYAASLLLFAAALLSKSVTCSLPAALILAMLWLRQPLTWRRILPLIPMFVVGLALALHTAQLERESVGAVGLEFDFSILDRLLIASKAILFYPAKLLWPHPLIFIYPRWIIDDSNPALYWPVLAVALVVIASTVLFVRGRRGIPLALAFYAGTVFPALGFFNVYPMRYSFVADHFQYLASLGIIALVVAAGATLIRRAALRMLLAGAVLAACVPLTWVTTLKYADLKSLWTDTARQNPQAWIAFNALGLITRDQDGNPLEALEHFRHGLTVNPGHYEARRNLAATLYMLGRYDEALAEYETARATFARLHGVERADDWFWIGLMHEKLGRADDAAAAYQRAVQLDARHNQAHFRLGTIFAQREDVAAAERHFQAMVNLGAANVTALAYLAGGAAQRGDHARAASLYRGAVSAADRPEDANTAMLQLLLVLLRSPDPGVRNPAESLVLAEELVRRSQRGDVLALSLLAEALAVNGRRDEAIGAVQEAVRLAQGRGDGETLSRLNIQLEQLQNR